MYKLCYILATACMVRLSLVFIFTNSFLNASILVWKSPDKFFTIVDKFGTASPVAPSGSSPIELERPLGADGLYFFSNAFTRVLKLLVSLIFLKISSQS